MKKNICENCGNEHDGSYGSGRFCSAHCRRVWIGKQAVAKRMQNGTFVSPFLNPKNRKSKAKYGTWKCSYCNSIFETKNALYEHNHVVHNNFGSWNKGKTKSTDVRLEKIGKTLHEKYVTGQLSSPLKGKHLSDNVKKKISDSMKKAHAEGRAHNIGESRWNNEPSYPEKWFMEVIANEISDKNYEREVPFHRFSLDFVWKHKKLVVEIDGKQHYEDAKQQDRDKRKDLLLKKEGWKLLRLDWRWICNNTQDAIKCIKEFIC